MKIFFVRKGVPLSKGKKLCGYFYTENNNPSHDWNDILFGCGWSEAEPVTKKIQWKAG
ncbi:MULTISPECIES: hypothetical protein [unclassified Chryseobacterium]|uniref:hypothetical protein n=1 Tax=unclassified Chryseobacterium TaxID=2593645 RepID=UPI00195B482E|nr:MULTISPECIES: hypothetical protein [unclassified Chryseobacterium]MBM7419252.1 hypothetical protein [Chryseobacterium sp. JUb44]MDH6209175.1 hypothetical protein [Chryseobacterium sp. BIGb0186]